jgi:hypothetical protein
MGVFTMSKKYHIGCCDGMFDWNNCFFDTLEQAQKALQDNFDIYELPYVISELQDNEWVEIIRLAWSF